MAFKHLLLSSFSLFLSAQVVAQTPAPLPSMAGLAMVALDRTPPFAFVGGEWINCKPFEPDASKHETLVTKCAVKDGFFQMDRQGQSALKINFDKMIYSEYDDATKPDDIKRIYSFSGKWAEHVASHSIDSRVSVSIFETLDGKLKTQDATLDDDKPKRAKYSGYIKSLEFDVAARLSVTLEK